MSYWASQYLLTYRRENIERCLFAMQINRTVVLEFVHRLIEGVYKARC